MEVLTKKDKPFDWTLECQAAYENIKQALMSPDIMSFPIDNAPFILDTVGSDDKVDFHRFRMESKR